MQSNCKAHNWKDIVSVLANEYKDRSIKSVVGRLMFGACVYYIWQERNTRLFAKEKRDKDDVLKLIEDNVKLRMSSLKVLKTARVLKMFAEWDVNPTLFLCKGVFGKSVSSSCDLEDDHFFLACDLNAI
ncbi:hypothetical protein Tco_1415512 [Tanacetum coccineum]